MQMQTRTSVRGCGSSTQRQLLRAPSAVCSSRPSARRSSSVLRRAAGAEAPGAAAAAVQEPAAAVSSSSPSPSSSSSSSGPSAAEGAAPTSNVWELDFCSRPLLDERGKKVWELVVTDAARSFEFTQYFPNSKINSAEVRAPGGGGRKCVCVCVCVHV